MLLLLLLRAIGAARGVPDVAIDWRGVPAELQTQGIM